MASVRKITKAEKLIWDFCVLMHSPYVNFPDEVKKLLKKLKNAKAI